MKHLCDIIAWLFMAGMEQFSPIKQLNYDEQEQAPFQRGNSPSC